MSIDAVNTAMPVLSSSSGISSATLENNNDVAAQPQTTPLVSASLSAQSTVPPPSSIAACQPLTLDSTSAEAAHAVDGAVHTTSPPTSSSEDSEDVESTNVVETALPPTLSSDGTSPVSAVASHVSGSIFFSPRKHADFVIHYDVTAFHVHKLVLDHHSAYFRAYFDTLEPAESLCACTRPCKKAKLCNHPSIAHCIHLPPQSRLVDNHLDEGSVTADDFDDFLLYLYYGAHQSYPPFHPAAVLDLTSPTVSMSLYFPPVAGLDWDTAKFEKSVTGRQVCDEALLFLAHYLDCAQMLAQCEAVLLSRLQWYEDGECEQNEGPDVLYVCSCHIISSIHSPPRVD